jgi:CRISPR-associated protein Csm3
LIVRDAVLTEESRSFLLGASNLDMPYTENKWENVIDRTKGVAEHPRQTERVPAGAVFHAEFVLNVWDNDNETELVSL